MSADTKLSAAAIERAAAYAAHTAERAADKIRALREELAGYEKYGKADRAALVREQLEALEAEAAELEQVDPDGDPDGDEKPADEKPADEKPKTARATQPRGRRGRRTEDA